MFLQDKYDLPTVKVNKSVIFATTPRSGSNMLCFSLIQTGVVGVPLEYFNHVGEMRAFQKRICETYTVFHYLNALMNRRATANGVFSLKLHFHQLATSLQMNPLHEFLPNCQYVYLHRKDKIRQAISSYIAYQSNQWFSLHPDDKVPEVVYSHDGIKRHLMEVMKSQNSWASYFKKYRLRPIVLTYEDMIQDFTQAVRGLFTDLGIQCDDEKIPSLPLTRSQSSARNEEWKKRFSTEFKGF